MSVDYPVDANLLDGTGALKRQEERGPACPPSDIAAPPWIMRVSPDSSRAIARLIIEIELIASVCWIGEESLESLG
jgi:hypothetical protein